MKLNELLDIWENDPLVESVILAERKEDNEAISELYHVLFKSRTAEYGRHAGLAVKYRRKNSEIIEHEIFNMTIADGNWVKALQTVWSNWTNTGLYAVTTTVGSTTSSYSVASYSGFSFSTSV